MLDWSRNYTVWIKLAYIKTNDVFETSVFFKSEFSLQRSIISGCDKSIHWFNQSLQNAYHMAGDILHARNTQWALIKMEFVIESFPSLAEEFGLYTQNVNLKHGCGCSYDLYIHSELPEIAL